MFDAKSVIDLSIAVFAAVTVSAAILGIMNQDLVGSSQDAVFEPTQQQEEAAVLPPPEPIPLAEEPAELTTQEVKPWETDIGGKRDMEPNLFVPDEPEPEPEPAPEPDADELDMLACVIYQEAGSDYISDETRRMVGDVVLNRMASDSFPATMLEVLTAPKQYGRFHWTGVVWPERAQNPGEAHAVERARRIARELLTDAQHSELYGAGYVWQAEFEQGSDIIKADGLYFGR